MQHDASSCIEKFFCDSSVLLGMSAGERALLRSQRGPLPYTVVPTCPLRRFDPDIFRVLLLRKLRLPLPLSSHSCRCGRPLDCLGHHRATCLRAGVLGRRGYALESAAGRVCREALPVFHGAQLAIDTPHRQCQDMDGAALEVMADFGQSDFGQPSLASDFWPKPTLAKPTLAKPTLAKPTLAKPTSTCVCECL